MDKVFQTAVILSAQDRMSRQINEALNKVDRRLARTAWKTQQAGRNMMQVGLGMGAALGFPLKKAADFERLEQSMSILNGSAEEGARNFQRIRDFSARTPFQLEELARAQNTMQGFSLSADKSFNAMSMIGDIAAVVGGDIQAISVAYGQAAAEGKLMTRDIRQFINQGVPAVQMLADTMGVATNEVLDLASQGQITFDVLEKAFAQATQDGGMFANGMEKQAATLHGMWSTFKDNIFIAAASLGNTLKPAAKDLFDSIIPIVNTVKVWVEENPKLTGTLMKSAAVFAGFMLTAGAALFTFGKILDVTRGLISGFGMLARGSVFLVGGLTQGIAVMARTGSIMKGLIAVTRAFNLTLLMNPFVLIATAIIGGALLIYTYWEPISNFFSNLWSDISSFFKDNWKGILTFMANLNPVVLMLNMFNMLSEKLFGINLFDAGKNIIMTIWNGIKSFASKPIEAIANMAGKIRDYLPFSPAKQGPLKDLHKVRIVQTVADNMNPGPAVNAMRRAAGGVRSAIPQGRAALAGSGGGGITINYSPTISLPGAGPADRESFIAILRTHKQEIAAMVDDVLERKNVRRF